MRAAHGPRRRGARRARTAGLVSNTPTSPSCRSERAAEKQADAALPPLGSDAQDPHTRRLHLPHLAQEAAAPALTTRRRLSSSPPRRPTRSRRVDVGGDAPPSLGKRTLSDAEMRKPDTNMFLTRQSRARLERASRRQIGADVRVGSKGAIIVTETIYFGIAAGKKPTKADILAVETLIRERRGRGHRARRQSARADSTYSRSTAASSLPMSMQAKCDVAATVQAPIVGVLPVGLSRAWPRGCRATCARPQQRPRTTRARSVGERLNGASSGRRIEG